VEFKLVSRGEIDNRYVKNPIVRCDFNSTFILAGEGPGKFTDDSNTETIFRILPTISFITGKQCALAPAPNKYVMFFGIVFL
jgi:hypothetical protein